MREGAHDPAFVSWAMLMGDWARLPLSGFVWEEDGQLVGNLSLIPYFMRGRRRFLIANVAVHPDYRRRGIARSLTARGIDAARRRNADSVWLQVREDNPPAIELYRSLGFIEQARRTSWRSQQTVVQETEQTTGKIIPSQFQHWNLLANWLERTYPHELSWHLEFDLWSMRPGLIGELYRLLTYKPMKLWTAIHGNRPAGTIGVQNAPTRASTIWLAVSGENENDEVGILLRHLRRHMSPQGNIRWIIRLTMHEFNPGCRFSAHQTLIWMEIRYH